MSGIISKPPANRFKQVDLTILDSQEECEIVSLDEAYERSKNNKRFYIFYMMMLSTVYSLNSFIQYMIPFMIKRPALL